MITYVGGMTIGAALPGIVAALATAQADIEAKVAALAAFSGGITPPSLSADLEIAGQIVANIEAAISIGIEPPSIDLQATLMAEALLAAQLQLQIILGLYNLLATAGAHVYHYSGAADAMGGELSAELAGGLPGGAGGDAINAIVIATQLGATWSALSQVFKVTP